MPIYFIAFVSHIALLYFSVKIPNKRVSFLLAVIAVLPLCLVAGLRDASVGTDTSAYPLRCFYASQYYSLTGAMGACSDQEPLFVILFWILGRLTGDFHAVLFLCEAIVLLPYILVVRMLYPRGYPVVGFFLCFVVFGYTLNIIRQCLATSMLVMMLYELFREKRVPAIVYLALAVGFHKMSIIGLLIWINYISCFNRRHERSYKTVALLACVGVIIFAICVIMIGPDVMELVSLFTSSYSFQIKHAGMGSFNITMLIYFLFCLAIWMLGSKGLTTSIDRWTLNFYTSCGIISSLFAQFASISPELIRLSFPFLFISGLVYPFLSENLGRERFLTGTLGFLFFVFYFVITFVYGGSCDLFPYSSTLLGVIYA